MLTTGLKRSDLLQEVQCAVEKSVLVVACVLNELMCYYYYVFPCLLTYIPTWHTMTSPTFYGSRKERQLLLSPLTLAIACYAPYH